jgi:hypothetical protein
MVQRLAVKIDKKLKLDDKEYTKEVGHDDDDNE